MLIEFYFFFFSSRRRHTRYWRDWSSDVCSSDLIQGARVVVTKELPVSGELIHRFPKSVELIVEAGTGYNNIDLDAARARSEERRVGEECRSRWSAYH